MKPLVTIIVLILLKLAGYAQDHKDTFTDDLLPDKNKIMSQILPKNGNGEYLYKFYATPETEIHGMLMKFRSAMAPELAKLKNPDLITLAKKDIDFSVREVWRSYVSNYGADSLGMQHLYQVVEDKKEDPNYKKLMAAAEKKMYTKFLDPKARARLLDSANHSPELDNELLFRRSASYRTWLKNYVSYLRNSKYQQDTTLGRMGFPVVKLKVVKNEIPTGFIKDYLIYQLTIQVLKSIPDATAKEDAYASFINSAKNPEYKVEVETLYRNYKMMAENKAAPDFSYANVDGEMVTLKSLRGSYVYIDVWATWCIPCKEEIPFLQKIEHDYKGKNIKFVSLSVDKMKDKLKWVSYVKEKSLGGIQVIADQDFNSEFTRKFNIGAIPRFILIDPSGNIISGNAYRPSDPRLRKQLEDLL